MSNVPGHVEVRNPDAYLAGRGRERDRMLIPHQRHISREPLGLALVGRSQASVRLVSIGPPVRQDAAFVLLEEAHKPFEIGRPEQCRVEPADVGIALAPHQHGCAANRDVLQAHQGANPCLARPVVSLQGELFPRRTFTHAHVGLARQAPDATDIGVRVQVFDLNGQLVRRYPLVSRQGLQVVPARMGHGVVQAMRDALI